MPKIKAEIVTVDQVISEGKYPWKKLDNDIEFKGIIPGYYLGFCLEVKKSDGTYGYSSVTFIYPRSEDELDEIIWEDSESDEYNQLGIMASCCCHSGNEITGRIVFRGYYDEHYDLYEREEYFTDASDQVLETYEKYHVEAVY